MNKVVEEEIDVDKCQSKKQEYVSSGEVGKTNLLQAAADAPDEEE